MLPEHMSSPPVLVGFVLHDLQFYVFVLQIVVCPFVLFLLAIVLSVLLRYTDSDYHFGIFKLFLVYSFLNSVQNFLLLNGFTPHLLHNVVYFVSMKIVWYSSIRFRMFNSTFNNISVISWQTVLIQKSMFLILSRHNVVPSFLYLVGLYVNEIFNLFTSTNSSYKTLFLFP